MIESIRVECKLEYYSTGLLKNIPNLRVMNLLQCSKTPCKEGEYQCRQFLFCINIKLVCNGLEDCPLGDDEGQCRKYSLNRKMNRN